MFATNFKTGLAGLMVLAVMTLTALSTGCGGLGALPSLVGAAGQLLPLGTALPDLPDDSDGRIDVDRGGDDDRNDNDDDNDHRGSSATGVLSYPGSVFLSAAGGTVDGDTLILQSSETEPAWAMYKADGLGGLKVDGFGVEAVPGDLGSLYSVGLSNFSDGRWEYLINSTLPEVQIDLTENTKRLTSQLGNLYYVVIVTGGKSVRVVAGHVFTRPGGEDDWVPSLGQDIVVSQGLSDRIHIEWSAVDGADSYELWRRQDTDSSGKGGSSEGSGGGEGDWMLLAATAGLSYDDFDVLPSTEYDYKVRGINAAGPGGFSRSEDGYMSAPPADDDGDGLPGELEKQGVIAELSADRLTLTCGVSFFFNELTLWYLEDETQGTPADFAVGQMVEVRGKEIDGVLTALTVEMEDEDDGEDEVQVFGVISELSADRISLDSGLSFPYTASTLWMLADGTVASPAEFAVGDQVEVRAIEIGDVMTAYKVKMHVEGGDPVEQWAAGEVATNAEGVLTLADGQSFSYGQATLWMKSNGEAATPDYFQSGMQVEIKYVVDGEVKFALKVKEHI